MTLDSFVSEIAQYYLFQYYQVEAAGWGLLIIAITVLILLLLTLKRKRKAKDVNILIYHNRQQDLRQKTSEQWEKAKTHIEKLLYEITEHVQTSESLKLKPDELPDNNERHYYDITKYRHTNKMIRERAAKARQVKKPGTPLDIQELQAVATLAKQLRARSQQRVRS